MTEYPTALGAGVGRGRGAGVLAAGLGHHVHRNGTPRLMQIAREEGQFGPHLALFAAIGRTHPQVLGKALPLNGAGVLTLTLFIAMFERDHEGLGFQQYAQRLSHVQLPYPDIST